MTRLWMLLGLLAGCAVDAAPDVTLDAETPTLTAVQLGADGAPQITQRSITAAQRDALVSSAMAARAGSDAGARSAHALIDDNPCALPSVFVFDRVNQEGNVLCLVGTGTFDLADYVHHWELVSDFFGDFWVPVGWNGRAVSGFATFFTAEFFEDGGVEPSHTLDPQSGENFIVLKHGFPSPERIRTVVVF